MLLLSWITLWIFFTGIFMIFFPWLNLFHSITKIPLENRKRTTNTNLESWQDGNEIKLFVDLEFWKYVKWISIVKSDFSPFYNFWISTWWYGEITTVGEIIISIFYRAFASFWFHFWATVFYILFMFVYSLYFDEWSNQNLAQKWACQYRLSWLNFNYSYGINGNKELYNFLRNYLLHGGILKGIFVLI